LRCFLSLFLAAAALIVLFGGCSPQDTSATQPKETVMPKDIMQKSDPAADDELNILMIGSSFCYYYVEELYGMLTAAGYKKVTVCNVYYSGCPLQSHWEWWKSGESNYEYFTTNESGRNSIKNANLAYCLQQRNWDVISLQESTHKIRNGGGQQHFYNTQVYLTDLWGYIKEQYPQSRYFWHQPWAYQVGADKNGVKMVSLDMQLEHTLPLKDYAIRVCKEFDLERVNSGEAWQIVREGGYDELCARRGVNDNKGDYSHDGDIGGGQYLNACVWFEVITGESCIGNTYRPDYDLDENLMSTLQEAAHQAVAQRNAQ